MNFSGREVSKNGFWAYAAVDMAAMAQSNISSFFINREVLLIVCEITKIVLFPVSYLSQNLTLQPFPASVNACSMPLTDCGDAIISRLLSIM